MSFFNQAKITGAAGATLDGTAGSPSTGVVTVQGVASGTAVPISVASLPLPAGAATAAKQPALGTAGAASADVITVQGIASMTALKVDGSAVAQPVKLQDGSGNAITSTGNKLDVNATFSGSISGNAAASATGSAVPAAADYLGAKDGSGNLVGLLAESVTNPNLRVAIYNGANEASVSAGGAVKVDGSAVTQPVSAASLPLPSGAATAAKQPALGTAGTASADVITVQGIASMTALKVDGSAVTQPVSAASLPLPSGASTSAKQPALGTAGSASADVITVQGVASMTALKVDGSAVTQPVSGTVSINAIPIGANLIGQVEISDGTNILGTSAHPVKVDGSGVTQPVSFSGSISTTGTTVTGADAVVNTALSSLAATDEPLVVAGHSFNGTTWDRDRSAGVGNNVGSTGLKAGAGYGQFTSPYPAASVVGTSNNFGAVQVDSMGRQLVNLSDEFGPFVVQKASATTTGSAASMNANFVSSNTAGNTIVVACAAGSNNTAIVVTDTLGNTYTQAASTNNGTVQTAIFYATNCKPGANTNVNMAWTASSGAMEVYEINGLLTLPNQLGQAVSGESQTATNTGSGTSATTAAVTPLLPNEIAFTALGVGTANVTFSAFGNYTKDFSGNTAGTQAGLFSFASFSQPLGGAAATSFAATLSGSEPWVACTAFFKPLALPVEGVVSISGTPTVVQATAASLNATVVQGTAAAATAPWPTKPGAPTTSSYTSAVVSFSSSGDNVLVSGVGGQTIRVFRIFMVNSDATTASNLIIKDATPTNLSGAFRLASGGSFSGDGEGDPLFVCATGKAFEINSSAAVQVSGTVWYTQS